MLTQFFEKKVDLFSQVNLLFPSKGNCKRINIISILGNVCLRINWLFKVFPSFHLQLVPLWLLAVSVHLFGKTIFTVIF